MIACMLLEMDVMEKQVTLEGGRMFLNKEETILLDVPHGAFSEDTAITCKSMIIDH